MAFIRRYLSATFVKGSWRERGGTRRHWNAVIQDGDGATELQIRPGWLCRRRSSLSVRCQTPFRAVHSIATLVKVHHTLPGLSVSQPTVEVSERRPREKEKWRKTSRSRCSYSTKSAPSSKSTLDLCELHETFTVTRLTPSRLFLADDDSLAEMSDAFALVKSKHRRRGDLTSR